MRRGRSPFPSNLPPIGGPIRIESWGFVVSFTMLRSEHRGLMKKRTFLLVATLGGIAFAVLWNQSPRTPAEASHSNGLWASLTGPSGSIVYANPPASRDTMGEAEALRQIEHLYRLQADLVKAQAEGDAKQVEKILDTAIGELHSHLERPGLAHRPQFREVAQSFAAEYERRYGVPDTLDLPTSSLEDLRRGLLTTHRGERPPALEDVLPTDLRESNHEVPLTVNRHVREAMTTLLQNRERYLRPWLRRASTYFPMIEHIFAQEGVPDELKYLALVESGLDPHAQSRARASGIWQFVARTGRHYGLTIDPWVDERLDPEKSTRAAAKHLKDLHQMFGDWELALAGYNVDPAVVKRARDRFRYRTGREASYWDIYDDLPQETRNYVPLFTATALIISNPAAFDLKRVTPTHRYVFDYVPVDAPLSLERVARLAETDLQSVQGLNPELRSDRLPPSKEPYYVRLPMGSYSTFAANYNALSEEERAEALEHEVRPGETAGRIAERYHVDRSSLLAANEDTWLATMQVGKRLTVPEGSYSGNARIAEVADAQPLRVQYSSRTTRPLTVPSSTLEGSSSEATAP